MFLDNISISPDCSAVNLSLAVNGTNLTFVASPSVAAATARQTSTSTPVQVPAESAAENPARPLETPQVT